MGLIQGSSIRSLGIMVLWLLPFLGYIVYLFFGTYYIVDSEGILYIKCGGIFNRKMDISRITKVTATIDGISAPAPSFNRLALEYSLGNNTMVAPKDRLGFVKALREHNPDLEWIS
ncbi:PH domain-containing protein [Sediminicola luteus]|uniref:Uncharacterized protein YyaB-like PH domain-containing protein n=1 Tax=Sediminicola luteus TaxID=319238 RepID=A0A2A4GDU9_9FLAO|nr:PH domain-containing protein [Sediminicola luteus]PCE65965.1 hypothetical protein B7P33_01290 [Sediminicola luteus]